MYLVDTSVWIHALRPNGHAEIREQLKPLIVDAQTSVTEWILLELMTGLTKSERPSSFLQWFTPIPRLPFQPRWWEHAWDFAGRLRKHGITPSAADCLRGRESFQDGAAESETIVTIAAQRGTLFVKREAYRVPDEDTSRFTNDESCRSGG